MRNAAREAWSRIRSGWKRPEIRAAPFAVLSAVAVVLLNNRKLFTLMGERLDLLSFAGPTCLLATFLALTGMISLAFLLLGRHFGVRHM